MKNLIRKILKEQLKNTTNSIKLNKIIDDIDPFSHGDYDDIELMPFRLIFGDSSLSIFDTYDADEIAGLKRKDCEKFLEENPDETDDAFIAGLTNVYDEELFLFLNLTRLKGISHKRIIPHECLHLTRYLITFYDDDTIDLSEEEWWEDVEFTPLLDDNEELFAEVLEITSEIVFNEYEKLN